MTRAPKALWRRLRRAATKLALAHAVVACALLGSSDLEQSKPQPLARTAGEICSQRFSVAKSGAALKIPVCLNRDSLDTPDPSVERVLLVIHGRSRNAASYYAAAADAVTASGKQGVLIVAPQFLTPEDLNDMSPRPDLATWKSSGWKQGDRSHPSSSPRVSSFEVLDRMINHISHKRRYPNLRQIIVAGHSAGGQFVNRYASGTRIDRRPSIVSKGIELTYIAANSSSYLYFYPPGSKQDDRACRRANEYKYGTKGMNKYMRDVGADKIRAQYSGRNVVVLLGRLDNKLIDPSKDDSCAGLSQGAHRLNRGIRFVGELDKQYGMGKHNTRLIIAPGMGHSAWAMFNSPEGKSLLFGT